MAGSAGGQRNACQNASGKKRALHQISAVPFSANGTGASDDDIDKDYMCPICCNVIGEAYMTKCGHSFCHECIVRSIELTGKCPKCHKTQTRDDIFPNFLLNELILKHKERLRGQNIKGEHIADVAGAANAFDNFLADKSSLDLERTNALLEALQEKKRKLEFESKTAQSQLLLEFLADMQKKKQEQLDKISLQLNVITRDVEVIERSLSALCMADRPRLHASSKDGDDVSNLKCKPKLFNTRFHSSESDATMATRRRQFHHHVDDFEQYYFSVRLGMKERRPVGCVTDEGLEDVMHGLEKVTRYTSFRTLATLQYNADLHNSSSIVSSIEFDKDSDYFAVAGVTKRIKVFEYSRVISDMVDVHYPATEMACNSTISCVAWSHYHKSTLASADYEGDVTLWDAFLATKKLAYQEHEKRCWCVDFNRVDPVLLASGSDDSRVKIYATNMRCSVASISARANVCSVQFNPESRFHLAFGSTDHCVYYYDMRNLKQALATLHGHRRAVSFIRFVSSNEIVSASIDSQLRLWNIGSEGGQQACCVRTLQGHIHNKNFVGLATDGNYVACGSEDNTLCLYYKGLSRDLMRHKFDVLKSPSEKDSGGAGGTASQGDDEFVSAVTWKPSCNVVLGGNSQGVVKVLELV